MAKRTPREIGEVVDAALAEALIESEKLSPDEIKGKLFELSQRWIKESIDLENEERSLEIIKSRVGEIRLRRTAIENGLRGFSIGVPQRMLQIGDCFVLLRWVNGAFGIERVDILREPCQQNHKPSEDS